MLLRPVWSIRRAKIRQTHLGSSRSAAFVAFGVGGSVRAPRAQGARTASRKSGHLREAPGQPARVFGTHRFRYIPVRVASLGRAVSIREVGYAQAGITHSDQALLREAVYCTMQLRTGTQHWL